MQTIKEFNVLQFNTDNSIPSFIYTQLNGSKYCYWIQLMHTKSFKYCYSTLIIRFIHSFIYTQLNGSKYYYWIANDSVDAHKSFKYFYSTQIILFNTIYYTQLNDSKYDY